MEILRKNWSRLFKYNWKFGVFLILLFGIPRFIFVLSANSGSGYRLVSILFILMWVTPFLLLSKEGRNYIGIKKPKSAIPVMYSFIAGFILCAITFALFAMLGGGTINNAFVYISQSYNLPKELLASNKTSYFIMFALVSMTFSPIGEELLYRGVIHGSFVKQFGEIKASIFDSLAFALTHIAHFGLVYVYYVGWKFLPLPSFMWILSMFFASLLFFACKQYSQSIFGAISAHAGYNFGMIYFIFYFIF